MPVLYEQQGGILEPEKMIAAHVQLAQYHGAKVHAGGHLLLPAMSQCHTCLQPGYGTCLLPKGAMFD
jgi:hypothetical protein